MHKLQHVLLRLPLCLNRTYYCYSMHHDCIAYMCKYSHEIIMYGFEDYISVLHANSSSTAFHFVSNCTLSKEEAIWVKEWMLTLLWKLMSVCGIIWTRSLSKCPLLDAIKDVGILSWIDHDSDVLFTQYNVQHYCTIGILYSKMCMNMYMCLSTVMVTAGLHNSSNSAYP